MEAKNQTKTKTGRVWLFRFLILLGMGVFLAAWFIPWWNMDIEGFENRAAQIRPWGLEFGHSTANLGVMLKGTEMPDWFPTFIWIYFALCIIAVLASLFMQMPNIQIGKIRFSLSQLLIGGVGFSLIFAGVFTAIYAGNRMKKTFDVTLQGRTFLDMGDPFTTYVATKLELGWYLLFVAGGILIILALLRNLIIGLKQTTE